MSNYTKSNIFLIIIILIAALTFLVIAGEGTESIAILSPSSGSNLSTNFTINITYVNATDITDPQATNITCYANSSGSWAAISNSSVYTIESDTQVSFTADISSIPDGSGIAINCSLGNITSTNSMNYTNFSTEITVDDTPPAITLHSTPVINGNYSGVQEINITISDIIGEVDVMINISNSSGATDATYYLSQQGSSDYWNASVNTSSFSDGVYNISFFVNDTLNNLNNTLVANTINFDNTAPTVIFSCTSSDLYEGDSLTCTCTASDSTSGLNLSYGTDGILFTTNPPTGSTGTHSTSCTSHDNAGNSASSSFEYSVYGVSSSSSSSTSSRASFWTRTKIISQEDFESEQGYTGQLERTQRLKLSVENKTHYVGAVGISSTSVTINVSSTPQQATLNIGEEEKFELTEDNYYDLKVKLKEITSSKAELLIISIHEEIPQTESNEEEEITNDPGKIEDIEKQSSSGLIILIIAVIVVLTGIIVYFTYYKKRN